MLNALKTLPVTFLAFICTALYGQHTVRDFIHLDTGDVRHLQGVTIYTSTYEEIIPSQQLRSDNYQRMGTAQIDLKICAKALYIAYYQNHPSKHRINCN